MPPDFVAAQLHSIFDDLSVDVIKTGMLANAAIIDEVAQCLDQHESIPVVVDPVMVATSGDALLADNAVVAVVDKLLPRATVITPNLDEAAKLLATSTAKSRDDMIAQGEALVQRGARAVLVKGGHAIADGDDTASDVLVGADGGVAWFSAPRVQTRHTHGTGCTLASALAAGLAQGLELSGAMTQAKAYLTDALVAGRDLEIGRGAGPVDHLVGWDRDEPRGSSGA